MLLLMPQSWHLNIVELNYAYFHHCESNRCDLHIFILYGDVIISIGCPGKMMIPFLDILAGDDELRGMLGFGRLLIIEGYIPLDSQVVILFVCLRYCDNIGDSSFLRDNC
jgi:hypothetical protein